MKKLQCFLLMSEHSFLPSVVFLIISQGLKMVTGIVVAWAHLRSMLITDLCVVRAGSLQTLYSQFLELCLLLGFCRWIVLLHWRWGEGKKYFSFPFLSFFYFEWMEGLQMVKGFGSNHTNFSSLHRSSGSSSLALW